MARKCSAKNTKQRPWPQKGGVTGQRRRGRGRGRGSGPITPPKQSTPPPVSKAMPLCATVSLYFQALFSSLSPQMQLTTCANLFTVIVFTVKGGRCGWMAYMNRWTAPYAHTQNIYVCMNIHSNRLWLCGYLSFGISQVGWQPRKRLARKTLAYGSGFCIPWHISSVLTPPHPYHFPSTAILTLPPPLLSTEHFPVAYATCMRFQFAQFTVNVLIIMKPRARRISYPSECQKVGPGCCN